MEEWSLLEKLGAAASVVAIIGGVFGGVYGFCQLGRHSLRGGTPMDYPLQADSATRDNPGHASQKELVAHGLDAR